MEQVWDAPALGLKKHFVLYKDIFNEGEWKFHLLGLHVDVYCTNKTLHRHAG